MERWRFQRTVNQLKAGFIAGLVTLAAVVSFLVAAPVAGTVEVSAVATDTVRDVRGIPSTPVTYSFEGRQVTAVAGYVSAVEGETVVVTVNAESGLPESRTYGEAFLVVAVSSLLAGMLGLLVGLFFETFESRVFWRLQDRAYRRARAKESVHQ